MHGEDFEFEEVAVSVAEGTSLEEFEFVVGGFEWSGRDPVIVPIQQASEMSGARFGELLQDTDAAGLSLRTPRREKAFGDGLRGLAPELSQVFLEGIRRRQRFVQRQLYLQMRWFELPVFEIL